MDDCSPQSQQGDVKREMNWDEDLFNLSLFVDDHDGELYTTNTSSALSKINLMGNCIDRNDFNPAITDSDHENSLTDSSSSSQSTQNPSSNSSSSVQQTNDVSVVSCKSFDSSPSSQDYYGTPSTLSPYNASSYPPAEPCDKFNNDSFNFWEPADILNGVFNEHTITVPNDPVVHQPHAEDAEHTSELSSHSNRTIDDKKRKYTSFKNNCVVPLSDEEKRILIREGYHVPTTLPFSRAEQKFIKLIRRKLSNREAARKSRQRKEEYVKRLEKQKAEQDAKLTKLNAELEQLKVSNSTLLKYLEEMLKFCDSLLHRSGSAQQLPCIKFENFGLNHRI